MPVYNVTSRSIVQQTSLRQDISFRKGQAAAEPARTSPVTGKILKNQNRTNLNAYLFTNLAVVGILLIGLWNRKPVWDVSIRFPNLLLILIIINTVLIFRETILAAGAVKPGKNRSRSRIARKRSKNLNELRAILKNAEQIDESLLKKTLARLQELSGSETTALYILEKNQCRMLDSAGEIPAPLVGSRFIFKGETLSLKFPGNLGEEDLGKPAGRAISFKSAITRLELTVLPLILKNERTGLCVFSSRENHKTPPISLVSTALYLETLMTLIESEKEGDDRRYLDKSTGLLRFSCFADSFETEVERSERYKQEMSLLTISIKNLASLSKEEKSGAGKNLAASLKQSLRRLDLMFCGEKEGEYLAILTETGIQVAGIVATRIQKTFAKLNEKNDFISKNAVSIRIGAATYPADATHGQGLLEKSHESMLEADHADSGFKAYSEPADSETVKE